MVERDQQTEVAFTNSLANWPRADFTDPDKILVLAHLEDLIRAGAARWRPLDDGTIELQFYCGTKFHLGETTIIRLA